MKTFFLVGVLAILLVAFSFWGAHAVIPKVYGGPVPPASAEAIFAAVSALVGGLGFAAIAITLVLQSRQLRSTEELATTGFLFEYYNAKIASLRTAIGQGRNGDNQKRLDELLEKHRALLIILEKRLGKNLPAA